MEGFLIEALEESLEVSQLWQRGLELCNLPILLCSLLLLGQDLIITIYPLHIPTQIPLFRQHRKYNLQRDIPTTTTKRLPKHL